MICKLEKEDYNKIIELANLVKNGFTLNEIGPNDEMFAYIENGEIWGFITCSRMYETLDILYIAVDVNHRRQGIARKLVEYISKFDQIERIMLEVRVDNIGAIAFYKTMGFELVRIIKNYYDGVDALSLERKLK